MASAKKPVIDRVKPALVLISTFDAKDQPVSIGSGFLLDDGRSILTSLHVFKRAVRGRVEFVFGARRFDDLVVVDFDIVRDLCVLRLPEAMPSGLVFARTRPAEGDDVIVAGNPEGLSGTFSRGIVSAVRVPEGLIQIDAPVSPGSSGGPVVDASGNVIGVVSASLSTGQNLNFAVSTAGYSPTRSWDLSIEFAGLLAVSDREADELFGDVERVESAFTNGLTGKITSRTIRTYDKFGNRTLFGLYSPDYVASLELRSTFSPAGILESARTIDRNNSAATPLTYIPIEGVRAMAAMRRQLRGMIELDTPQGKHVTIFYDPRGRAISQTTSDGVTIQRSDSDFDERGFEFARRDYTNDKLTFVSEFAYKTDAAGNWTSMRRTERYAASESITDVEEVTRIISYR